MSTSCIKTRDWLDWWCCGWISARNFRTFLQKFRLGGKSQLTPWLSPAPCLRTRPLLKLTFVSTLIQFFLNVYFYIEIWDWLDRRCYDWISIRNLRSFTRKVLLRWQLSTVTGAVTGSMSENSTSDCEAVRPSKYVIRFFPIRQLAQQTTRLLISLTITILYTIKRYWLEDFSEPCSPAVIRRLCRCLPHYAMSPTVGELSISVLKVLRDTRPTKQCSCWVLSVFLKRTVRNGPFRGRTALCKWDWICLSDTISTETTAHCYSKTVCETRSTWR